MNIGTVGVTNEHWDCWETNNETGTVGETNNEHRDY
jgi:hypothetical protein